jgi:hypothetical protein
LTDTKEFFEAAKRSSKMIVHFFRRTTPRCEIVDAHFQVMAARHLEARFVKVDVEKNPYLVEKLGILLLPTIVLVKDGKTEHSIRGFDEMGGADNFSTSDFEYVLSQHGMIHFEPEDNEEKIKERSRKAGLNSVSLQTVRRSDFRGVDEDD